MCTPAGKEVLHRNWTCRLDSGVSFLVIPYAYRFF